MNKYDRRILPVAEIKDSEHFFGGMRVGKSPGFISPRPLVRIDFFGSYLRFAPRFRFLRFVAPVWEVEKSDIAQIDPIGYRGSNSGLRVTTNSGDWVIFTTSRREPIVRKLRAEGMKVGEHILSFNRKNPGA